MAFIDRFHYTSRTLVTRELWTRVPSDVFGCVLDDPFTINNKPNRSNSQLPTQKRNSKATLYTYYAYKNKNTRLKNYRMTIKKTINLAYQGHPLSGPTLKGYNSVSIHSRTMWLDIQGHIMSLKKFSKQTPYTMLRKDLAHKGLTKLAMPSW